MLNLEPVEYWENQNSIQNLESIDYWNNIHEEAKKEWWIVDGNYKTCTEYLYDSGLMAEYDEVERLVKNTSLDNLSVLDLAAGIGWISSLISKLPNVGEVHAVEISKHRLEILFEHSIKMFDGCAKKIRRYWGDFNKLRFADKSMDIIIMAQAFHHSDSPLKLLLECDRVLKPGGRIIMIGENYISRIMIIKRFIAMILRRRSIEADFRKLFPPDDITGDNYYRLSEYKFLFYLLKYKFIVKKVNSNSLMIIGEKP